MKDVLFRSIAFTIAASLVLVIGFLRWHEGYFEEEKRLEKLHNMEEMRKNADCSVTEEYPLGKCFHDF